jgi:DNA-binding beta-propeller fold protein YncE
MRITRSFVTALTVLLFAGVLPAVAQANWEVARTFKIGGEGGWDYLTVDAQSHRLFVPRSTHTLVIDSESGKTLADIPGQKIAHGVVIFPEAGRGFISDGGGDGGIVIFDLKTYAILGTIVAQKDADGIIYDPASRRVVVVSGDNGVMMSLNPDVDPKTGKIDPPIDLGGAPEFLASDGAGKIYVNLMDKNVVAVVDFKTRKVVARWPVAPGGAPVGMSIDTKKHRLVIGCRKPQKLIVMSTDSGKVLAALPIGPGVDAAIIDEGQALASCGDGTLAVAGETPPGKFKIMQTLKTRPGARTMGLDPTTHRIYLPTAEVEERKPGATGRPAMKPGTFMIIVAARHTS